LRGVPEARWRLKAISTVSLLAHNTVDNMIMERLSSKKIVQVISLEALKRRNEDG
jgi:hypothetical protein